MYNFAFHTINIIYFVYLQNTDQHNLPNNQDDTLRLKTGKNNKLVTVCCHCVMVCASWHIPII